MKLRLDALVDAMEQGKMPSIGLRPMRSDRHYSLAVQGVKLFEWEFELARRWAQANGRSWPANLA
jgi:hypothetical protein